MFHVRSDSAVCFLNCIENNVLIHVFENTLLLKNFSGGRTRWWSSWMCSTSLSTDISGMHLQTQKCLQNTAESGQEYLTSGKEYIEQWKTR